MKTLRTSLLASAAAASLMVSAIVHATEPNASDPKVAVRGEADAAIAADFQTTVESGIVATATAEVAQEVTTSVESAVTRSVQQAIAAEVGDQLRSAVNEAVTVEVTQQVTGALTGLGL